MTKRRRRRQAPPTNPTSPSSVLDALAEVYDPELDEPITSLGFVAACEVSPEGDVEVVLQLPTPQCAPNFAFLMAADARRAVRRLPDVREVTIRLNDHYTGREINDAINRGDGFMGAFPGETADDELASLRELFLRKSLVGRQSRLCEALLADGCTPADIASKRVAELPDDPNARRCLELRRQLGLADAPESPAFVLPSGEPVVAAELTRWLRTARLMRLSLEVNGGICRSLLRVHRGVEIDDPEEVLT
jgi:metal-sulfur cluster biosynthetic enzyme